MLAPCARASDSILPIAAVLLQRRNVRRRRRRRHAQNIATESTCRESPARCGSHRTSPSECCPAAAVRRASPSSSNVDAPEAAAVHVGNAVVLGQALVEEGVVGAQQIEHAAVLAHDALEEQLGLLPEGLAQIVVEIREQRACPEWSMPDCAGTATAPRSCSPARASADRPACAAPAVPAPPAFCSLPLDRPHRAVRRRECCSTGRTTAAMPVPDR